MTGGVDSISYPKSSSPKLAKADVPASFKHHRPRLFNAEDQTAALVCAEEERQSLMDLIADLARL